MPPKKAFTTPNATNLESPTRGTAAGQNNARTRTSDKRQKLERDYAAEVEGLVGRIEDSIEKDEREIATKHVNALERLAQLLARRAGVEDQIFAHTMSMAQLHGSAFRELTALFEAKGEALEEVWGNHDRGLKGERGANEEEGGEEMNEGAA